MLLFKYTVSQRRI